jgi:hypothetical protein
MHGAVMVIESEDRDIVVDTESIFTMDYARVLVYISTIPAVL